MFVFAGEGACEVLVSNRDDGIRDGQSWYSLIEQGARVLLVVVVLNNAIVSPNFANNRIGSMLQF